MPADEARKTRRTRAAEPLDSGTLDRYPETRIGAFGFSAATCTEPLGCGSADVQRACGDSWPEVAEDLWLFSQEDPIGMTLREALVQLGVLLDDVARCSQESIVPSLDEVEDRGTEEDLRRGSEASAFPPFIDGSYPSSPKNR